MTTTPDCCSSGKGCGSGGTDRPPAAACCDGGGGENGGCGSGGGKKKESSSCCAGAGGGTARAANSSTSSRDSGGGKSTGCCNDTSNSSGCCADDGSTAKDGGCCGGGKKTEEISCCSKKKEEGCCVAGAGVRGECCADKAAGQNDCCSANDACCPANDCCSKDVQDDDVGGPSPLFCLAVVRPDNSTIDVYDARGKSRAFKSTSGSKASALLDKPGAKICYSTHGAGNGTIDGLLTPCFDENGEHGEPDEGCFCGIDEPHLHAHVYDPDRCKDDDDHDGNNGNHEGCGGQHKKQNAQDGGDKEADLGFLAQLTLQPADDSDDMFSEDMVESTYSVNMPINESLPKQCNSSELKRHLGLRGLALSHWTHWRGGRNSKKHRGNACCATDTCTRNRMYKVQHEDHTDFLVHNDATGDLHLEHPCDSCGENDIHGRFRLIHSRNWMDDGSDPTKKPLTRKGRKDSQEIRLHFFEARREPFRLLDVLTDFFELESSRVHAVREIDTIAADTSTEPAPEEDGAAVRIGRSQFFVEKICCASEIPAINSIVKPLPGVSDVTINTTTKTVYVDHDVDMVSADDIAKALNDQRFGAHVKKDAAVALAQTAGIPTDAFVESKFRLSTSLPDDEVNCLKSMVEEGLPEGQVRSVSPNLADKTLVVEHNPYFLTATGLVAFMKTVGFDADVSTDGAADGTWALSLMKEDTSDTIEHHKSTVRWTVILSGVFWIISMLSYIGGNWEYLKYVALLSVVFGLPPIAQKAFRTLRRCHFDANCMMMFAAIGAVALQEFVEAAAVTFLFAISEFLESKATARARNALSAIVCLRPERASVVNPITKEIVVLPASAVSVGAIISVRTGDAVPCDGVVIEGKSTVDESSLTGESRPVHKGPDDMVSGGTINTGSTQLVIKTTATSDNSAVARLIRLVEEAQANRSETEKLVDAFAKVYTPIVVLTAACMCTIPWAFGRETGRFWTMNGLITIVIACPCALIISTPVTYVAGLAAAAQKGVIVKGGAHLEALGNVKNIAFDKTGTLSEGIFALLHVSIIGSRPREQVLEYLALMEAPASHPLSDAIVKGAANEQVAIPKHLTLQNHTILPGEGITAIVEGKYVHVGNEKLFRRLGLYDALPKAELAILNEWAQSGGTVGFISIEGEGIVGAYCVADKIRNESKRVVKALKKMGIEITMLTGDQRPAAIGIGNQIGLGEEGIKSQLLPEDKLNFVSDAVEANKEKKKCWKAKRNVMMVGDGVNDAPALAIADVSAAMGEGAALAMETSDVTLIDSDLHKLLYIVRMGRRVIRTIIENVTFSLVTKAIVMGFTFAGKASLWAAIATDLGAMLLVTLNGMKLLPSSRKVKQNELLAADEREASDSAARKSFFDEMRSRTIHTSTNDPSERLLPAEDSFIDETPPCNGGCCSTELNTAVKTSKGGGDEV